MKGMVALFLPIVLMFAWFSATANADQVKVGFVYVGPTGDHGWTYMHDQGRLAVEAEFGDNVTTMYVESVSEGPDAERVMMNMAMNGADIIFATSFGYMDQMLKDHQSLLDQLVQQNFLVLIFFYDSYEIISYQLQILN